MRAGTALPSVTDWHHGQETVQVEGFALVPSVKAPPRHCRHRPSEELCTQPPSATSASTVPE
ncbi:hypothetical protein ACN28S_50095 [Cystobacter fuscus]